MKCVGLRWWWTPVVLGALVGGGPAARAAEEYENFLNELRNRGHFDMALFYLEQMRNSPLISEEQRQMIEFEEARTNLETSRIERDPVRREQALDAAAKQFSSFAEKNPNHPQVAGAKTQQGAVLVERGRAKVEQALSPQNAQNKAALMTEARKYFDEAEAVFLQAETTFKADLEKFPKFMAPNEPGVVERERVKGDLIQARMFYATCVYEKSQTYDEKTKERNDAVKKAADAFGNVYKEYRTLIAGLAARLQEGKCYQELGDTKRALGLYNDLLTQPDELKPLRPYKAGAMDMSLQCWCTDAEKLYELATIQGDEFLKNSSRDEINKAEWLAVRYHTAVAHQKFAAAFPADAPPDDVKRKEASIEAAIDYANFVASVTNEYQDPARDLMKSLGVEAGKIGRKPRSFAEAKNRGMQELETYMAAYANVAAATDADMLKAARDAAKPSADETIGYFRMALNTADSKVSDDEKNEIRYYMCYVLYTLERYYESAVLGEFLLQHYPNSGGARQSAIIALGCYATQHQLNQERALSDDPAVRGLVVNPEVDRKRMYEIAEKIAARWINSAEADEAWNTILTLGVSERDLESVRRGLAGIQPTSPLRAVAELAGGRAMWQKYNESLVLADGTPGKLTEEEMKALAGEASVTLKSAIERARPQFDDPKKLTLEMLESQIFLCEAFLAQEKNAEALECVKDPQMGLLAAWGVGEAKLTTPDPAAPSALTDLIADRLPSTTAFDAMRLIVQTYVVNGDSTNAEAMAVKLKDPIEPKLPPEYAGQVSVVYLNMAVKLDEQVNAARARGDIEAVKTKLPSMQFVMENVLKEFPIVAPEGVTITPDALAANYPNSGWVAESYYRLAGDVLGMKEEGPQQEGDPTERWIRRMAQTPTDQAEDLRDPLASSLLQRTVEIDNQLVGVAPMVFSDPGLVAQEQYAALLRSARARRRAGEFDLAVDEYVRVLTANPNMMDVQAEAAETLRLKAVVLGRDTSRAAEAAGVYLESVNGARPGADGQNVIWGWHKLADGMRRQEAFMPVAPAKYPEGTPQAAAYPDKLKEYYVALVRIDSSNAARHVYPPPQEIHALAAPVAGALAIRQYGATWQKIYDHRYAQSLFHLGRLREAQCYMAMADLFKPGEGQTPSPERIKHLNAVLYATGNTRGYDPSVGTALWSLWSEQTQALEETARKALPAAG